MFSYGGTERRSVQSLSFTTYFVDFDYNGSGDPVNRLDFSAPAYGIVFSRPSFAAAVVWATPDRNETLGGGSLNFVDATVSFWGNIFGRRAGENTIVGIPIVVHSGFRSVEPPFSTSPNDGFSYTTLGLGGGLSVHSEITSRFWFDLRAWPAYSMTFRSFEGFAGGSFLVDSDVQVHLVDLFGSMGISLAYGYRYQTWNNNETGLPGGIARADQFDYKSGQHMLKAGINW